MSSGQGARSNMPNTTTTTTTTTTTSVTTNRRGGTGNSGVASTSQTLQLPDNGNDGGPASRTTSGTEPFPQLQPDPISRVPSRTPQSTTISFPSQTQTTVSRAPRRLRPISIQRLSSSNELNRQTSRSGTPDRGVSTWAGRSRSASAPQGPNIQVSNYDNTGTPLQRIGTAGSNLPIVHEDSGHPDQPEPSDVADTRPNRSGSRRLRRASDAARSVISRMSGSQDDAANNHRNEYESEVVDLLDVLDPEVSALTTLTNVQNSLFVPDLGGWLNRRPTYTLSRAPSRIETIAEGKPLPPTPSPVPLPPPKDARRVDVPSDIDEETTPTISRQERRSSITPSIASVLQEDHFAVLPHGVSLEGWTQEEKEMLDDHVRHMLHSRRSKFRRSMRAFGKYVSKPLGFLVTLYATLITLFGLAWVLFLIGWIYVGDRQSYIINIIDNVLVALFAVVGDGMAPFRAVDTYHMIYIAHYHHLSWRLRKEKALPELHDHNDLPKVQPQDADIEASRKAAAEEELELSVLTDQQQKKLEHHTAKFCKSHSFYKPHETATHHAFPLRLLVAIVVLLDCHSLFQIALGACTWGISYHVRPGALTATILCCSITVNILAGVLIKVGDGKTRKKEVLKRMYRQELTQEAMKKVEKKVVAAHDPDAKHEKELEHAWNKKHVASRAAEAKQDSDEKRISDSSSVEHT